MNLLRELDHDDRVMSGAILTTFSFAPRFFERAVLPALTDKSLGEMIAVLVDDADYEATLDGTDQWDARESQQYPRVAGQQYQLAPVSAGAQRAFHPKVHFIAGERRVQATIASANLTHPGLTANREIATRVTVAETPNEDTDTTAGQRQARAALCRDVAEFLQALTTAPCGRSIDPVTTDTIETVLEAGDWLAEIPDPDTQGARLLQNLEQPILTQVREHLGTRGESIQAVDIAAPFYGTGLAVPRSFTDDGIETRLWLQQQLAQIVTDELETWLEEPLATALTYDATRYVHGKVLKISTDEADYILSGSPNASVTALQRAANDGGGNIEAAVLRRYSDTASSDYLFDTTPFTEATPIDMATFDASDRLEFAASSTETTRSDQPSVQLHGVSYRRRDSYDGGTLTITGSADKAGQTALNSDGLTLQITPAGRSDDATTDSTDEQIKPRVIDWNGATPRAQFTAELELFGQAIDSLLSRPATAQLDSTVSTAGRRWIQTHTPETGEPTAADVEDAGATAVPRTLTRLYQDDATGEAIESLNGLLAALRAAGRADPETHSVAGTEPTDTDDAEPSGGLHVREWSQTGGDDPTALLESFFEGWETDLDEVYGAVSSGTYHFETVETRLIAINATTLQLLVLDNAQDVSVPRQLALNTLKNVYSQESVSGQLQSHVADYCTLLQFRAKKDDSQTTPIYSGLREQILPQILLAALIAEAHVAGDRATYIQQQDWAFERLANECFPEGHPTAATFTADRLDTLVTAIWDSIVGIRDRIDESRRLRRHADERYLDRDQLRWAVVEFLGRCLLVAGSADTVVEKTPSAVRSHLERVIAECREYPLPDTS